MEKILTASLEKMGIITAKLAKTNYDGKSDVFFLRNKEENIPLKILSKVEKEKYFEYQVAYNEDEFEFGVDYLFVDEHGLSATLEFKFITHDPKFTERFKYDGEDLGPIYNQNKTTIKVWSPTATNVILELIHNNVMSYHIMKRSIEGVYSVDLIGDYELASYVFLIKVNGEYATAIDPYAYSSTANHTRSVIIDKSKTFVERFANYGEFNENVDAIIYELSVRDFSVDSSVKFKNRGKYSAFFEEGLVSPKGNMVGIDYLATLGVTHVQILPIYDFGSVDELNQFSAYNWGYDPVQLGVPEGSYAVNVRDPYSRIIECKKMIEQLHKRGLRVNLDIVFNHVFDRFTYSYEKIVPYYFFKMDNHGNISNGSFCSNDFDSTQYMAQKYILDILKRWVNYYNADGFRFDLMGILDIQTINSVVAMAKNYKKDFMVYGEGWNMPTMMDDRLKASQQNNSKMPLVGFFSDRFRDAIKGSTSVAEEKNRGYCSGSTAYLDVVRDVMCGSCLPSYFDYCYLSANNVINYVECHDNNTLWDKLTVCCANESIELRKKRQRLINAVTILAPGVPFIHAGQEFLRTKNGNHNSYKSSDEVNKIDWTLVDKNIETINYFKDIIKIRKKYSSLKYFSREDIQENIKVEFKQKNIMKVVIKAKPSDGIEELIILINPNSITVELNLEQEYELIVNDLGITSESTKCTNLYLNPVSLTIICRAK